MLSDNDKQDLLNSFPNIELSYETMMHNKVHNSDIILAIPDGLKFFAWFTEYNHENVSYQVWHGMTLNLPPRHQ